MRKKSEYLGTIRAKVGQLVKRAKLLPLALAGAISLPASAQGLSQANTLLNTLYTDITTIIPIVATIALVLLFIGYMMKMIQKDLFVKWLVGILGCGCAAQIVAMLYV